jgi:hypothetical protein
MPRFLTWSLTLTFWGQILQALSLWYVCYMPLPTHLPWFYRLNETANNAKYNTPISGQSSWLQIQRSGFDSRRYQIFWEVVGLERGPLSLVSTIEELFGRKSSGSGLENREYGRKDPLCWPCNTVYPQKLALTSTTSGGRSVGIVHSRIQATEFFYSTPIKVYQILVVIRNTVKYVIRVLSCYYYS